MSARQLHVILSLVAGRSTGGKGKSSVPSGGVRISKGNGKLGETPFSLGSKAKKTRNGLGSRKKPPFGVGRGKVEGETRRRRRRNTPSLKAKN